MTEFERRFDGDGHASRRDENESDPSTALRLRCAALRVTFFYRRFHRRIKAQDDGVFYSLVSLHVLHQVHVFLLEFPAG
jgi:hypothetical protein